MSIDGFVSICSNALRAQDLSTCKPLGLDVSTWIAALTALAGVLFFLCRWVVKWRSTGQTKSHYISSSVGRSRFRNLCSAVKPLMDENYRIFLSFGPNGGRGEGLPKAVRHELGVWYQLRETIVKNNNEIRAIITSNQSAIPTQFRAIFVQWLDHIDAFGAHVLDEFADYRDHQFPKEVSMIVARYG